MIRHLFHLITILCLVGFISIQVKIFCREKKISMEQNFVIEDIVKNAIPKYDRMFPLPDQAIGYIWIPSIHIQNMIYIGTERSVLDQYRVGLLEQSRSLDSPNGKTVLAGHNVDAVFHFLHNIEISDPIYIQTRTQTFVFYVEEKKIVDPTDISLLKEEDSVRTLVLVTCTEQDQKRLIIIAKLKR